MHELANDINGDPIDVPEAGRLWRLRRHLGGRGASVVVTGEDHAAVLLPIGATHAEFHDAVKGAPGKYTLYPCDEHGRPLKGAAVAHVFVADAAPRNANAAATDDRDALLRELVRANTDMCKAIIDKFAGVMTSGAELIRAADGAGIPARPPAASLELDEDDDQDDDDDGELSPVAQMLDQVASAVSEWLHARKDEATASVAQPTAAAATSLPAKVSVPASPSPATSPTVAAQHAEAPTPPTTAPAQAPARNRAPTSLTPLEIQQLMSIKAQLTADESRRVDRILPRLSSEHQRQWLDALCSRSVDDAVALVRKFMAGQPESDGGAS